MIIIRTWACLIAATGIDAAGACGGGGLAAGGGIVVEGGADGGGGGGGGVGADGDGGAALGVGGLGAFSAGFSAGGAPTAPMSMVHSFCPGFTVSPSLTNISFITPGPGAGTGTEVCKRMMVNLQIMKYTYDL